MIDLTELPWSEPRKINTRRGERIVRHWHIPTGHEFWNLWKTGAPKEQGYSVRKHDGEWELTEWRMPTGNGESEPSGKSTVGSELSGETLRRFSEIEGNLLEFQREHTKRLIASVLRSKDALDASDTGTGKTYCALAVAYALGLKPLVVCPKQVIAPWKKAARYMRILFPLVINYEMIRRGTTEYGGWHQWTDARGKSHTDFKWAVDAEKTIIIFDECHRLKNSGTLQSNLGIAAVTQGFNVMALSATAADNPMHMKFIATLCKLIRTPSQFFGWMMRFKVRRVGKKQRHFIYVGGKKEMLEIHKQLFPAHGSRIRVKDLGDKFPHTLIVSEAYDMDEAGEIQSIYDEMKREIAVLEQRMEKDWKANVLTVRLRARQKTELLKVPTLCEMAKDAIAEGNSVVIFVNFEASLQAVAQRLKTTSILHGNQKESHRQLIIQQFCADEEPLVVANIRVGGVGIGLHGKRQRLGLLCPSDSPTDVRQALGRLPRPGGGFSIQKIVWAAGTIEEDANEKLRAKLDRINTLNDGELAEALSF